MVSMLRLSLETPNHHLHCLLLIRVGPEASSHTSGWRNRLLLLMGEWQYHAAEVVHMGIGGSGSHILHHIL